MKILYVLCILLSSQLSFATESILTDLVCDQGKTVISLDGVFDWGGFASMQTSDIEILRIMKNNKSVRGSILKEGIQGLDRGEFIFVANDWTKVIAGKSVSIAKVIYLRNGRVTLELNIRKSPMVGCLKEEVVSGCYAGEDCITRCLQEVNIPEEVYFSKIIDCEKKNSKNL